MFTEEWKIIESILPFLLQGLWATVKISIIGIVLGSLLGGILGTLRSFRLPVLTGVIGGYLHLFRGSPFLIQLYVFYFVLPELGIPFLEFDSWTASIVALSLYTACYVTEIVNAAILAVPRGQEEAARSLGMTKLQAMWHVVLPQALRLTIPPMSGVYVIIIKSTAILSVVGIGELTRQGEVSILRYPSSIMLIYGVVALLYFIYCYPVLRFTDWAEKRVGGVRIDLE
ncbi:MAG: amino acid ABC transporter permease [Ectothiorhodospiraceae bacterium]|jgi:polar amino acid transport system permease protein